MKEECAVVAPSDNNTNERMEDVTLGYSGHLEVIAIYQVVILKIVLKIDLPSPPLPLRDDEVWHSLTVHAHNVIQ
jgi:hypothetical protein